MRGYDERAIPLGRLLGRVALCAALLVLQVSSVTWGAPTGATVVRGEVKITQKDNKTIIRASNRSIITYESFNIDKGEVVRFIQPSSRSRVLNRVLGGGTTYINGALYANGRVYIVNRAGVRFGRGSIVDVGALYAVAGSLSNRDFLNGIDRFTDLRGEVINHGTIRADDSVHLLGRVVANYGTLVAERGVVAMVAGDEVMLGTRDGHIHVKVTGGDAAAATPAVTNDGTIIASKKAVLGAGDIYSLAIRNTGTVKAPDISVKGGRQGTVEVSGTLDASDHSPEGGGGRIEVLGDHVALEGATLDASGTLGGGTIHVGGGFQGSGDLTASRTFVDADTVILSNAVQVGDGGTIVVWADELTWFFGEAQARGGALSGDGGLVEVSGKDALAFRGSVALGGDAAGTLLLDPDSITVVNGAGAPEDAQLADDQILFGDSPPNAFTISEEALEALGNAAIILLQANNTITINDLADNALQLDNTGGGGSLTFQAGPGGTFAMEPTDTIDTQGSHLTIVAPGGIILGGVDAGSGGIALVGDALTLDGSVSGSSGLIIRQSTAGVTIDLGDDVAGGGGIELNEIEISHIQEGFAEINFGDASTGPIEVNDAAGVTFTDPTLIESGIGITVDGGGLHGTDDASLTLKGPGLATELGADLTTQGQPIQISDAVVVAAPLVNLDTATAAPILIEGPGSIEGAAPGTESLTLNGATVTIAGDVGATNHLNTLTTTNSSDTTFQGVVQAVAVDLQNTGGAIEFQDDLTTAGLTTVNQPYSVSFLGANNTIDGFTQFLNTGTATLASGGATSLFIAGVGTSGGPGLTQVGGTVATTNASLTLGPTTLTGSSALWSGAGGTTLGAVTGAGFDLEVNSTAPVSLQGAITGVQDLALNTGGAAQAPLATIGADTLLLTGVGNFVLPEDNAVGTLSAYVHGSVEYTDLDTLTVDRYQPISASRAILSGDSNGDGTPDAPGGDVTITSGGTLTVARDIDTSTGAIADGTAAIIGGVIVGGPAALTEGSGEIVLNGAPTGDVTVASDTNVSIVSSDRDIIVEARVFSTGGSPIELRADSDSDGVGGVWVKAGGHVDSNGEVLLDGADLFAVGGDPVSVQIDPGGMVDAATNVTIQSAAGAPPGADVLIGGPVTAVGSATFSAADRIVLGSDVAAGGVASFLGPVDLSGPSSVSGAIINMSSTVSAGLHALTLTGNTINLAGAVSGTGALALGPQTAGLPVSVGDDAVVGGLVLSEAALGLLADGFSSITIGNAAAGAMEINDVSGVTFQDPATLVSGTGITVAGGGLHGVGDASLHLDGPTTFAASADTEGQPIHVSDTTTLGLGLIVTLNTTANGHPAGAAITFDGPGSIEGASDGGESLLLNAGSNGDINVAGPVGTVNRPVIMLIVDSSRIEFDSSLRADILAVLDTTDTVSVKGNLTLLNSLGTAGMPYSLSFTGSTNSIAGDTSFLNTGTVTLGDGGDTFSFPGGLATAGNLTNPSMTNLGAAVSTTNAQIDIGPATLVANSSLVAGTAPVNVESVTDGAFDLTIQNAAATGPVTFGGVVNLGSLTTFAGNYSVSFQGTTTVAADTDFLNTGVLNLGNGGGDVLTFAGGLDTTTGPSTTTLNGDLRTTDTQMDLMPLVLQGDSALRSGAGLINVQTVTGPAFTLELQAPLAAGTVDVSGDVNIGGLLANAGPYDVSLRGTSTLVGGPGNFLNTGTVTLGDGGGGDFLLFAGGLDTSNGPSLTNLAGTIVTSDTPLTLGDSQLQASSLLVSGAGPIDVGSLSGPAFSVGVQNPGLTGPVTFAGDVDILALITFSGPYDVALLGTTTQIAGATVFQNAGVVTLGDGGDTLTFPGGVETATNASRTDVGGTVQTTNTPIAFGDTRLVGGSALDAGASTVDTLGIDGNSNDLAVNASMTTVAGPVTNIGDGVGPSIDVMSGNATFQSTITGNSGIAALPVATVNFADDVVLGNGDTGTDFQGVVNFGSAGTAPLEFSGFDGLAFNVLNFGGQSVRLNSNSGNIDVAALTPNQQDLILASGIGGGQTTFPNDVTNLGDNTGYALEVESGATGRVWFQGELQARSSLYAGSDTNIRFDNRVTLQNRGPGTELRGTVTLTHVPLAPGQSEFSGYDGLTFGRTILEGGEKVAIDSHSDSVRFLRQVTDGAPTGLIVDADPGTVLFAGDVSIQNLNVKTRGDIEFRSNIRTNGSTRLASDLGDIPLIATIYKSVPGDLTFRASKFIMGKHAKLTVVDGDLTIKAGTATIGDLNAGGSILVDAGTIRVMLRDPALVLMASGAADQDTGVDFVANNGIRFSGNIQLVGSGQAPRFAALDAGTIVGADSFERLQLDSPIQLIRSGVALDGAVSGSDISSVLASAISWAALLSDLSSVTQGMTVSPAVRELLEQLGIFARDLHPWELAALGGGVSVHYDDIIQKILEDVVPSDHTVPVTRLPADLVDAVVATYQSVFMEDGKYLDEEELKGLIQEALDGYRAAKKPAALVPADFAAYLTSDPPPHPEALALLRGMARLFGQVAQLGLTDAEQFVSEGILVGSVLPPGVSPGELIQTIRAVGAGP